jgi:hypothetical protein
MEFHTNTMGYGCQTGQTNARDFYHFKISAQILSLCCQLSGAFFEGGMNGK